MGNGAITWVGSECHVGDIVSSPDYGHSVRDTVFVSYSRRDSNLATSVVKLLRSRGEVFFDLDGIVGGQRWKDAVMRAIDDASHFYVLLCVHPAQSKEVGDECARAIGGSKRVVPVLLDSTPLVESLGEYQWVDFRPVIERTHDSRESSRAKRIVAPLMLSVLILVLMLARVVYLQPSRVDPESGPFPEPGAQPFPAYLAGGVVLALVLWAAWGWIRRRRVRRRAHSLAMAIADDLDSHKAR